MLAGAFTPGVTPLEIATTSDDNFDTDDATTLTNATTAGNGDEILGLSVLTADDAEAALAKISVAIEQVGGTARSTALWLTACNIPCPI